MYRRFREMEKEDAAGSPKGDDHAEDLARGAFSGGYHSSG
jgi:hypothetical protein